MYSSCLGHKLVSDAFIHIPTHKHLGVPKSVVSDQCVADVLKKGVNEGINILYP